MLVRLASRNVGTWVLRGDGLAEFMPAERGLATPISTTESFPKGGGRRVQRHRRPTASGRLQTIAAFSADWRGSSHASWHHQERWFPSSSHSGNEASG